MRVLVQTKDEYIVAEVANIVYDKPTDTVIMEDVDRQYRVVVEESKALRYFDSLLKGEYVDLSTFVCTVVEGGQNARG